jgi:hypothetical protein
MQVRNTNFQENKARLTRGLLVVGSVFLFGLFYEQSFLDARKWGLSYFILNSLLVINNCKKVPQFVENVVFCCK